jgi:hypothetical protein
MPCSTCRSLERTLEAWQSEFLEASCSAFHRFNSKFAAYINVELERAKSDLEDHRSMCVFASNEPAPMPVRSVFSLTQQENMCESTVETAA